MMTTRRLVATRVVLVVSGSDADEGDRQRQQ
jgi:hypothetical protein